MDCHLFGSFDSKRPHPGSWSSGSTLSQACSLQISQPGQRSGQSVEAVEQAMQVPHAVPLLCSRVTRLRCLQLCVEELRHGSSVWTRLAEQEILDTCLGDAQVCAYLAALGSVQLVACLISSGEAAAAEAKAQCDAAWACTAGKYTFLREQVASTWP